VQDDRRLYRLRRAYDIDLVDWGGKIETMSSLDSTGLDMVLRANAKDTILRMNESPKCVCRLKTISSSSA
jgi:hypothetical protein